MVHVTRRGALRNDESVEWTYEPEKSKNMYEAPSLSFRGLLFDNKVSDYYLNVKLLGVSGCETKLK